MGFILEADLSYLLFFCLAAVVVVVGCCCGPTGAGTVGGGGNDPGLVPSSDVVPLSELESESESE